MHGAKTPNVLRLSHLAIFVSFYLFLCVCVFLASWQQPFPIAETIFFSRSLCKTPLPFSHFPFCLRFLFFWVTNGSVMKYSDWEEAGGGGKTGPASLD